MIFTIVRNFLLVLFGIGVQVGWSGVSAADYDITYSGPWRNTDDSVNGWDWTLPPATKPAAHGGIYNYNSSVPKGFSGNHLKQVNFSWRDIEPTQGNYNFSAITADINDPSYDGVMLNIRGLVWTQGNSSAKRTAPDWLNGADKIAEGIGGGGVEVTNLKLADPQVKNALIAMIGAFGKTGISANPRLKGAILHGVSSSLGEEWTGKQSSTQEAEDAMKDVITAWANAYNAPASGNYAYKLAWMKPGGLNDHAISLGTGSRGAAIERWLKYTPEPDVGQLFDQDGYLTTDDTIPEITDTRHFQDQNESYRPGSSLHISKYGAESFWPLRYRHANLRAMQMRRNIIWLERNGHMNPPMFNWVGLQLGQTVSSSPDAWVLLMRSWSRHAGEVREVNNFERWLYQRDINGVTTTPTLNVDHGWNAAWNSLLSKQYWNSDIARKARSIGIAVDDKFLAGGPHSVAIKVTYYDDNSEQWSLVYDTPVGEDARRVQNQNSGKVRTATFFLDNFTATALNKDFEFTLESPEAATPFMFVRLIKLTPGSSAGPMPDPPGPGPGLPPGPDPGLPGPGPGLPPGATPPPPQAPQELEIVPS